MRFLIDECVGPPVAAWLREQGHDVVSIYEEARGLDDDGVIQMALEARRVLVTSDKDFGDKVYKDGRLHYGVILLRLEDERATAKIKYISRLLTCCGDRVPGSFVVVSERRVRFARTQP